MNQLLVRCHVHTCYITNTTVTAGRHCRHVETERSGAVATDCNSNLEDYLDTLDVTCEGEESEAAILEWTPDDDTPDVVYYQVNMQTR